MYRFQPDWPPYSASPADIEQLYGRSPLGIDLEFSSTGPTILGLSDGEFHVSVPWHDGRLYLIELLKKHPDTVIVGHNFISADFPLLLDNGIPLKLEQVEDSILWWWLTNAHLSKGGAKTEEDEGDIRGRGFNALWNMASVHTSLAHWKDCRGTSCSGPCPAPREGPKRCPNWKSENEFHYNALDSAAPVIALPQMKRRAQLYRCDHLYPMHRELAYVLAQMQEYGVFVDVPYIKELDVQFRREKDEIERGLTFNPKSPKAVVERFKDLGLEDAQEASVRELVDDLGEAAPADLVALLTYKELGNGTDRWFQEQYRDKNGWLKGYRDGNGYVHPRLNFFTSSARLACSSPNFQNVYKRKGEHIRKAIIAPPGWYIVRADYSNAENRYVLHRGGYTIPRGLDLHIWVGEMAGLTVDMELVKRTGGGKIRQAAKSIQHANNILEGLQLKAPDDLRKAKFMAEVKAGARVVHPEWRFRGKVVTFTGSNLSRRTYGDATWEHRRDALEISAKYFDRFPGVRDFQKEVSRQCEIEGAVRTPLGYCLLSFGDDEERMKIAQGVHQQQPIAHLTKLALLRLWKRWKRDGLMRPVLQVHDEILTYVKDSVSPATAMAWLVEDMEIEMVEVPGLIIPADPTHGRTWAESDQFSS